MDIERTARRCDHSRCDPSLRPEHCLRQRRVPRSLQEHRHGDYMDGINAGLLGGRVQALAICWCAFSLAIHLHWKRGPGVYKSTDRGLSWTLASKGLTSPFGEFVSALVIDPLDTRVLYAATMDGVFKSIDSAESWVRLDLGLGTGSQDTAALAIDPLNSNVLYAGTSLSGVLKSTDAGASWQSANNGLNWREITHMAVDPSNPGTLYAGARGLFRSTDGGGNWSKSGTDVTGSAIAIDPAHPKTLYLATGISAGQPELLKSTDAGSTWATMSLGLDPFDVATLAIDPSNTKVICAGGFKGVLRSKDGGATWVPLNIGFGGFPDVQSLVVDPTQPDIIHAGSGAGGVFTLELDSSPIITQAFIRKKHVVVVGVNLDTKAVLFMDGNKQKTKPDDQNPNALLGKKSAKRIGPGQQVLLQVQNPDGTLSNEFPFTKPQE
jgi:photosystem II stability/assembly factor-like uncharacterized protein